MNSFLNPHNNGPSLTGVIDVTAQSISLFQENAPPKNIEDIFIPKSDISIAEPYDVPIGDNIIQMYQFIGGGINDIKVAGLESLLNYMNENLFSKDAPAVDEHYYNIIKNNNTLKKQIIFTMPIKVNFIISKIIDTQMNIIIIKNNSQQTI